MIDTNYYLDQLDILKEYMYYWIEFKDKERVREENIPKDAIKMEVSFLISSEQYNNKNIRDGVDLNKVMKGDYAEYVAEKQEPYLFKSVVKTFNSLEDRAHREAKQMIINSIRKFT